MRARRLLIATLLLLAFAVRGRAEENGTPTLKAKQTAAVPSGTPVATVEARPTAVNQLGPLSPRRVIFHPSDPDRLLIVEAKVFASVWNVARMDEPFKEIQILATASDAAFAPDGLSVVTAGRDGVVRCWGVRGTEKWAAKPGGDGMLYAIAATSHPPTIAAGGVDRRIHLLGADGASLGTLPGHDGVVLSLTFSPDGQWLASDGSDTLVRLWRRKKGGGFEPAATLRKPNKKYQQMLPNLVWLDVQWGWGETVVFSPDQTLVLTANLDGTACLWKRDGRPATPPFTDHGEQHVRSVAYSPLGDVVATAGFDGTVRLWKPDGSAVRAQPVVRFGKVATSMSFSADGHKLAATGLDDRVRVSRLDGSPLGELPRGATAPDRRTE